MRWSVILCLACTGLAAQPADPAPAFEVASVTRIPPGTRHGAAVRQVTPTSLTLRNASLGNCIYWAFGYEHYQVAGPEWRDRPTDVLYDIVGKTGAPVPESQLDRMLRTLLKERLGRAFHLEKRDAPVYLLVVDRNGPKFHHSPTPGEMSVKWNGYAIHFEKISMAQFARTMDPPFTSRHVMDETGLDGIYDFTLDLAPYVLDPETGKPIVDYRGAIDEEGAHIQALPKQLGLRLERKSAPLEVMVIDRVEKEPIPN